MAAQAWSAQAWANQPWSAQPSPNQPWSNQPWPGPPWSGAPWPGARHQPPRRRVVETLTRRNWAWVVGVTAVLAAVIGAAAGLWVGLGSQQTMVEKFFPNRSVFAHPSDVQAVLAKVEPAVVSIETMVVVPGSGSDDEEVQGAGSGMIIDSDGLVLTNNHVIAGAKTVTVTLFGQSHPLSAYVVGADPTQDVALVQIEGQHGLPTVQLGDSSTAQVGDDVVAIGNALDLPGGPTVTEGIVSAKNRSLTAQGDFTNTSEHLSGLLQTDAPINAGNSGGPLVNAQAEVIGMNTAVAQSSNGNAPAQDIGFAIAIDNIKPLLPHLMAGAAPAGPSGHAGAAGAAAWTASMVATTSQYAAVAG